MDMVRADRSSMRLRSSQFVFLLLLVCSVQTREEYALHLVTDAAAIRSRSLQQQRQTDSAGERHRSPTSSDLELPAPQTRLDPSSLAATTTPWSMRRPALQSAAVSSFTGFLRT